MFAEPSRPPGAFFSWKVPPSDTRTVGPGTALLGGADHPLDGRMTVHALAARVPPQGRQCAHLVHHRVCPFVVSSTVLGDGSSEDGPRDRALARKGLSRLRPASAFPWRKRALRLLSGLRARSGAVADGLGEQLPDHLPGGTGHPPRPGLADPFHHRGAGGGGPVGGPLGGGSSPVACPLCAWSRPIRASATAGSGARRSFWSSVRGGAAARLFTGTAVAPHPRAVWRTSPTCVTRDGHRHPEGSERVGFPATGSRPWRCVSRT